MDDRDMQPRGGLPAKHVFLAIFLAVIVAGAGCAWMLEKAQKPAAAVLAFDPEVAQHLDTGLMSAREPAVALADAILTDSTVAGLAKQAHLAATTPATQIGEFRAALHLTQPSPQELRVRFVDAAPAAWAARLPAGMLEIGTNPSADAANAVARALVAWNASQAAAPASPPAPAAQPPSSPAPPAAAPTAAHPKQANAAQPASAPHPVADALGGVAALLSTTDRDLDQLGGDSRPGHRNPESGYTQSRQQHLLKTQISAAEVKLDRLRAQDTTGEVKSRLAEAQGAVRSILGAGRGFNTAGTSATELRRERAALRRAIGVVQQDQQAIQKLESAQAGKAAPASAATPQPAAPAASPSANAPAAPAPASAASASAPSAVQEQNLPQPEAGSSAPLSGAGNPLTVLQMASPPGTPRLWIPIVAGGLFGLLYLGLAGLAYRHRDSDEAYAGEFPARFITPSGPVYTPSEPVRTADRPLAEPAGADAFPRRRASFAMESKPGGSSTARNAPWPRQEETPMVVEEEPEVEEDGSAVNDESAVSAEDAAFTDRLRRDLSATSIGRKFEPSQPEAGKKSPEDTQTNSTAPDRLVS